VTLCCNLSLSFRASLRAEASNDARSVRPSNINAQKRPSFRLSRHTTTTLPLLRREFEILRGSLVGAEDYEGSRYCNHLITDASQSYIHYVVTRYYTRTSIDRETYDFRRIVRLSFVGLVYFDLLYYITPRSLFMLIQKRSLFMHQYCTTG
jgi:hypothetical protein